MLYKFGGSHVIVDLPYLEYLETPALKLGSLVSCFLFLQPPAPNS